MIKKIIPLVLIFIPSCIPKKCTHEAYSLSGRDIPLHIEMPENNLVFENLSPLVYDALWNHFNRVGFRLVDKGAATGQGDDCYALHVKILRVDSPYKFLSPDLLSYAVKMKIELLCQLFDCNGKLCAKKQFSFVTLLSKAKTYVKNSSFIDFEYRRLLEREVYRIDQHFRPFLLKSAT